MAEQETNRTLPPKWSDGSLAGVKQALTLGPAGLSIAGHRATMKKAQS